MKFKNQRDGEVNRTNYKGTYMKLITEYNESHIECLVEKKENGDKDYTIQGIFNKQTRRTEMVVFIQKT